MQAAVYEEFNGPIRVRQVARPTCPTDGVVIEVRATGVCRSDWHGWKGHDADVKQHGLPFTPGHEVSGVVVESCVPHHFAVGDAVVVPIVLPCGCCVHCHEGSPTVCLHQEQPGFTMPGSFAEYLALPRAVGSLAKIPQGVSFVQAAALGCRFSTGYRAVYQQGQVKKNHSIAIFGCGGLGLSCILLAVGLGCSTIIAVDVSEAALEKAKELGATHQVNASCTEKTRHMITKHITQGGVHVSIEASGFAASCENAVHCTRPRGRVVQVGLVCQQPEIPLGLITGQEIELVGSHCFAAKDLPKLLDLVASGVLDPSLLVEKEVTLEEGAKVIEDMDYGSPLGVTMITNFAGRSRL